MLQIAPIFFLNLAKGYNEEGQKELLTPFFSIVQRDLY